MPNWRRRRSRSGPGPAIRTEVTVHGDVPGQLAVGTNIVQMRVDHVLGNVVTVLPRGTLPSLRERPTPVGLLPRRPVPMFDRVEATAEIVAELAAGRATAVHGPSGMGKSTLLRHVAHQADLPGSAGGVVHLSARGRSSGDVVQSLVDAFYVSDVPVRLPPAQARHHLQHVRAAVLLDDVELSDDAVGDLADHAPRCGLVVAGSRPRPSCGRSITLAGLPLDAARPLLERALGRPVAPDEEAAVAELWRIAAGAPGRLVALGVAAAGAESLTAYALRAGPDPPGLEAVSGADARVLGLLAAIPGLPLGAEQLAAISGVPDVERRLFDWLARGLVVPTDPPPTGAPGPRSYRLASGVETDPQAWALDDRREELTAWFTNPANHPDTLLVEGGTAEPVRLLHDDARRRRRWGAVAVLGALLGAAHAASGHWDAWHAAAEVGLEAARASGDRAAEGLALHQLGTEALCRGDLTRARDLLSAALDVRAPLGHAAATAVTRHNLDVVGVMPPLPPAGHGPRHHVPRDRGTGVLRRIPLKVWGAAVVAPLLGGIALIGATPAPPEVRLQPDALTFAAQAVHLTSGAQTIRLDNGGHAPVHVDGVTVTGRDRTEFTVLATTCSGPVAPGAGCSTTVVFTPVAADTRQASLNWHVRGTADVVSPLAGSGVAASPTAATVAPASLDFDDQALNVLGPPQTVRLTAPPSGPLELRPATVDGENAADFLLSRDGCAATELRPGESCDLSVRFAPSAPGARSALITVRGTDGRTVAAVPLGGSGTAPAGTVGLSPTAVAFGDQALGSAVATRPVTVTATGPVDLTGTTVVGDVGFTIAGTDCPPRLTVGATCTITVAYAPTELGPQTAMLLLQVPGRPAVPLSGSGVPGPATLPRLDPSVLDFGTSTVGDVGAERAITVTNTAAAPLRLGDPHVDGAAFHVDAAACQAADLAPGASCRILLSFAPTMAGRESGILSVTLQGVDGRAAALLEGTATDKDTTVVPAVVGLALPQARRAVLAAGLQVGTVTPAPQNGVAAGTVIDQTPTAGLVAARNTNVGLQVAGGPDRVAVPDVTGLPQADAEARLDAVGLRTGVVTRRPDKAAAGTVISSDPAAPTPVDRGSPVDIVVSTGADLVTVPDVVGHPLTRAQQEILAARLVVGTVTPATSDTVTVGDVVLSKPPGGGLAAAASVVDLVVSSGPMLTTVPACIGLDEATARGRLGDAGLRVGAVTQQPQPVTGVSALAVRKVAPGTVLACTPVTGTLVNRGTAVDLVVAAAPVQVPVPALRGLTLGAARTALEQAGLALGTVGSAYDATVPEERVVVSDPVAGQQVDKGIEVAVVLSAGPPAVTVPDLVGKTATEAKQLLDKAGLRVGGGSTTEDGPTRAGIVLRSDPAAGENVPRNSGVDLFTSSGMTTVPDVSGMTQADAKKTLTVAGLVAGPLIREDTVDTDQQSIVSGTDKTAGSRIAVGTTVGMYELT